jgi:hypothetical protein
MSKWQSGNSARVPHQTFTVLRLRSVAMHMTLRNALASRTSVAVAALCVVLAACGGSSSSSKPSSTTTTSAVRTTPASGVCSSASAPPSHYESVVVFSFENRRWSDVGLGFGPEMPYLHALGRQCAWFPQWQETDTKQDSLTQYIGAVTGARQPGTINDCSPSPTCSTRADNIFRQLRNAGRRAVDYVEGATQPCSAAGNAARHIPALYLWGADDRQHCNQQVRPLSDFDVKSLPAFSFVTPTLCHDGHDCGNDAVDAWASQHVQSVLDSSAYRAGKVAVFIWYDEDSPAPNLWLTPTAAAGGQPTTGAGSPGTLKAWQSMLNLPCLADACSAADMRTPAHS